jgi:DNA-binding PadR family transcriptional regulator
MSETVDRRHRTDLDLFVLALIESGVSTAYQLQKEAGLSQGATIPTLQRLSEVGFVRQGKLGPRGRTDYKLTAAGRKTLMTSWHSLIEEGPSGDLDADLRVALLALWVGGDRQASMDFLRHSAARIAESIRLTGGNDFAAVSALAHWYSKLRSVSGKALLEAEFNAVLAMAAALPRKLSPDGLGRKRVTKLTK